MSHESVLQQIAGMILQSDLDSSMNETHLKNHPTKLEKRIRPDGGMPLAPVTPPKNERTHPQKGGHVQKERRVSSSPTIFQGPHSGHVSLPRFRGLGPWTSNLGPSKLNQTGGLLGRYLGEGKIFFGYDCRAGSGYKRNAPKS